MRARRNGEQWREIVAAFERSNQSVERYCAKRDILPGTLRWWRWRLRSTGDSGPETAVPRTNDEIRLVPVSVVGLAAGSPRDAAVEITFADVCVRVEPGTDAAYVATLVAEIRSRC
jgi:hypothetical protein